MIETIEIRGVCDRCGGELVASRPVKEKDQTTAEIGAAARALVASRRHDFGVDACFECTRKARAR